MLPELGQFALILALLLALAQCVLPLLGAWRGDAALIATARPVAAGQFVFVAFAFGILTYAFLAQDFSVRYVAQNSNLALPWYYRFSAVWGAQFFLAGLPMILVIGLLILAVFGGVGAYFTFHHVQARVDKFLNPEGDGAYQVTTALNAFKNGGLFGRGPGEGRVKLVLPDAHTDFILAVAGEEFGIALCLVVVALFAFIVLRGFSRLMKEENLFVVLATAGLLVQFGLQAIINMASTLRLMPTKGMTLPFISYGGSSMLALALGMGMVLALTRTRYGTEGLER